MTLKKGDYMILAEDAKPMSHGDDIEFFEVDDIINTSVTNKTILVRLRLID